MKPTLSMETTYEMVSVFPAEPGVRAMFASTPGDSEPYAETFSTPFLALAKATTSFYETVADGALRLVRSEETGTRIVSLRLDDGAYSINEEDEDFRGLFRPLEYISLHNAFDIDPKVRIAHR